MPNGVDLPSEFRPPSPGDPTAALEALRRVIEPLAEADKHRANEETKRYERQMASWDRALGGGQVRFLTVAGMIFTLVLVSVGFAIFAYVHGSEALATHIVTAVFSFLAGIAAGWGIRTRQQ